MKKWRWLHLVPLLIIIAFSINDMRTLIKQERLGFGVWRSYPETTVNFLKEHDVTGRIFNTYGYGGYLIWHLWPDIPVFIDGRTPTIYDNDFFWLYGLAARDKDIWEKVAQNYGIEIVLVRDAREMGYASFLHRLDEDEGWRLVAFDDESNLYLKRGGRFDGLIERYGFHDLRPADVSMDYAKDKKGDVRYLKALGEELKEACRRYPDAFYPFYYLGVYHQLYGTRDHLQEAEKVLKNAVTNRPDLSRGHYELGFTLMKLKRYDEAARELKKSIKLQSNLPVDAYYYLGFSLFHKDEIDGAIKFLEKYKEKASFRTRVDAYKLLGSAYMKKYRFQKALSCFERVGYLEKPTWDILVNKGVAYFGMDNLDEARESFEQAMEINPDQLKVVYNLAVVYEKLGLQEEAKRLFEKAAQLRAQDAEEEIWLKKAKEKAR
ncbi:MAG: tetratricopeptide repeat protein [Deltaproteobacteria bacterium]|nr:tetratricopeptide repeat protein [Deltaproteobacteria bacterium]